MPDTPPISLSVSVVSYHASGQELLALISSLIDALKYSANKALAINASLFLIDNSEDQSLEPSVVEQLQPSLQQAGIEFKLIKGHGNVGYGKGHNLAINRLDNSSPHRYHLIVNPDVIVDPACLWEGLTYLENNRQVGVVSPYAESGEGIRQYLCKRYPSLSVFLMRGFYPAWLKRHFKPGLDHYEMRDLSDQQASDEVSLVSGCFMLCRTDILHAVAGFDENYFLYFEDFDLSLRIGKTAKLAYLPSMKITHHGGNSAGKGFKHILMFIKSGWRFFNTYGWRLIQ